MPIGVNPRPAAPPEPQTGSIPGAAHQEGNPARKSEKAERTLGGHRVKLSLSLSSWGRGRNDKS